MLKYRDAKHIRSGFIGAVLIMLIIAVGLAPERLVSWATTIHYQALFSEAGGIAAGAQCVGIGSQDRHRLRKSRCAKATRWSRFGANGKVRLGSQTTAHIRTGSLLGATGADLGARRQRRDASVRCHTDVQDILALFTERGDSRALSHELGGDEHQYPQPVAGRAVDDDPTRSLHSMHCCDVRRAHPTVAGNQQPR